ncbi:MAG: ChbG/HpnK family deacetylase [Acidimicrobiales bacterium]
MSNLSEKLGYEPDAKLLIVSCTNLGQAHGTNLAVYEAIRTGLATSGSLMVPCAWSRDAASRYRGEDIGVQLTLNSELDRYRWGPITMSPSLFDGDGGLPRTLEDLWDHADIDEVRRECRAQIERAVLWGFDITHLDSHLGTLHRRPEFFDVYLDLACEFELPITLSGSDEERAIGFPARSLAEEEGILTPDHVVEARGRPTRQVIEHVLFNLQPGVTALSVSPAIDAPEIRGLDPKWSGRVEDYLVTSHDAGMRHLLERSGAVTVGYRELRAAQRS